MVNAADLKSAAAKAAWGFEPPSRHGGITRELGPARDGRVLSCGVTSYDEIVGGVVLTTTSKELCAVPTVEVASTDTRWR